MNIGEITARAGMHRSGTGAGILRLHGTRFGLEIPGPSLFSYDPKRVGFPSESSTFKL